MTTPVYFDDDADLSLLTRRKVAVIGYGDHGAAQALCLRDSGVDVRMGLPPTSVNRSRAQDEGLPVCTPSEAAAEADVIVMLAPLALQRFVYEQAVAPVLAPGKALLFTDGFPIRYGLVTPPPAVDVLLLAPMGDGALLRRQYLDGKGQPCLVAVEADASGGAWGLLLAYAKGVGATRAGVRATTFAAQAEAARFAEQAIVGGTLELVRAGFTTLTSAGLSPDVAYLACVHQLQTMAEDLYAGGLAGVAAGASEVARFGAATRGPRVVGETAADALRQVFAELRDGTFVAEWVADEDAGRPKLTAADEAAAVHPVEAAGAALRGTMSWLDA
ncbi:ketol-acid reductoisomerase (NADP(+)) [Pilimelia terevasa]|uniref:Ketol-acid reductoisomerase n=1 Tax=Pilimelia terevasa TaxID=53372 RepID=A0A8J3BH95_9ACTN|nr:ketol-acid reductoisomerase [Pilimelia terevasa]GGK19499.1 ketol-acid reductoisomerase (NADP(+)) [Pilimelia terevasa]